MKKFVLILALATLSSCFKDQRINIKLDGNWQVLYWNGKLITPDYEMEIEFSAWDGRTGDGKLTFTEPSTNEDYGYNFEYEIDDENLIVTNVNAYMYSTGYNVNPPSVTIIPFTAEVEESSQIVIELKDNNTSQPYQFITL